MATGAVSSALLLAVAWPGFMSYDSLRALQGARQGVEDALWPPMVSYIWWLVELVYPGPAGMLFFQNMLLGASIAWFLNACGARLAWAVGATFLTFALPPVLGPSLVVWKDIEMAAFLMAGYASYASSLGAARNKRYLLAVCAASLAVACLVRHNAFFAVVPLITHWALTAVRPLSRGLAAAAIGILAICFLPGTFINSYRLPDLKPISTRQTDAIKALAALDAIGASICSDRNFFEGSMKQPFDVDFMRNNYNAKHLNLNEKILARVDMESFDTAAAYRTILRDAPRCLFASKIAMGRFLLGINDGPVFYITHAAIDANEFGYTLQPSRLRDWVVQELVAASYTPLAAPVTYLLMAAVLVAVAAWRHRRYGIDPREKLLLVSGSVVALTNFLVLPAADLRYSYWPVVAWSVASLSILSRITTWRPRGDATSNGALT